MKTMGDIKEIPGVTIETLREGDGTTYPKKGDKLTMHYKGTLVSDGSKFDSSYDRGQPFQFKIGKGDVIKGWDDGVMKMSLGEKAKLTISSDYAYGAQGIGPIPGNADLIFEVELLKIGNKDADIPSEGGGCCSLQ
jgi:FK506-binding protein 1